MRLVVFIFLMFHCHLVLVSGSSLKEKLALLQGLTVGSDDKKKVIEIFGKPNKILDLKDLHESTGSGPLWKYFDGEGTRLSISFEPKGNVVLGWTWTVLGGDSEQDLKTAMSKFPEASWEAETPKWVNPHQVPMECFFRDAKKGISISYSRAKKEVTAISRWNPTRVPASLNDEKPPKFCIENSCSDGIPSKDYFKDNSPCQLPK